MEFLPREETEAEKKIREVLDADLSATSERTAKRLDGITDQREQSRIVAEEKRGHLARTKTLVDMLAGIEKVRGPGPVMLSSDEAERLGLKVAPAPTINIAPLRKLR